MFVMPWAKNGWPLESINQLGDAASRQNQTIGKLTHLEFGIIQVDIDEPFVIRKTNAQLGAKSRLDLRL